MGELHSKSFKFGKMTLHPKPPNLKEKKHFTLLRFEEIIHYPILFILVMKYSKLLYEPLYKSLIKVNKKIIEKFRIEMQNLLSTKTLAMVILPITY